MKKYIRASKAAETLGVRMSTLARWRYDGTGPKGWVYLSATMVGYPEDELVAFVTERATNPPRHGRPPRPCARCGAPRENESRAV